MFLSLPHCNLDIFSTGKHVNHGDDYGLEILANFPLYGPENAIKLAKNENITKIDENLNETVKNCLK